MTDTTPPLTASEIEELKRDLVTDIMALSNYSDDPMWANHAEVSKAWLKRWLAKLNEMPHLLAMVEALQSLMTEFSIEHQVKAETIASLRRQLAEREAEVERSQTDCENWRIAYADCDLMRQQYSTELAALRRQLAERDAEVERLENEGQECARRYHLTSREPKP